jgi:hypothetical protein
MIKIDPHGVEDKDALTPEASDLWEELVLRTAQSLGMTYLPAEHFKHVMRDVPRPCKDFLFALPPPILREVAWSTVRAACHGMRLNRFIKLVRPIATSLIDLHKREPARFWGACMNVSSQTAGV